MKKFVVWTGIVLLLCIGYAAGYAQTSISQALYHKLPDSLRPQNPAHVTMPEFTGILRQAFNVPDITVQELELFDKMLPQYVAKVSSTDCGEGLAFCDGAMIYWSNKCTNPDSPLKYVNVYLKQAEHCATGKDLIAIRARAYAIKSIPLCTFGNFNAGYDALNQAMVYAKQVKDTELTAEICTYMVSMFTALSLHKEIITYADSALNFYRESGYADISQNYYLYISKIASLVALYEADTTRKEYARQAAATISFLEHAQINSKGYAGTLQALNSQLQYEIHNYKEAISVADKALAETSRFLPAFPLDNQPEYLITALCYRALSLIKLGRHDEGISELQKINVTNPVNFSSLAIPKVLATMYDYYKSKHNYAAALPYLERLRAFEDSSRKHEYQAQVFTATRKYDLLSRDLEIQNLKAREARNRWILAVSIIIALFIFTIIVSRYLHATRKTKKLVQQIDALIQVQMEEINKAEQKAAIAERKRLGEKLHHDLAATIGIVSNFLRLKMADATVPEEQNRYEAMASMLTDSYVKIRTGAQDMYSNMTVEFLRKLKDTVLLFFSSANIRSDIVIDETDVGSIPTEIKTLLLHAVREIITNIVKYAHAQNVSVLFYTDAGQMHLEISDDGRGGAKLNASRGIGLTSISENVHKIGGTFSLVSPPDKGTEIILSLPAA